jgi:hypothetical protein
VYQEDTVSLEMISILLDAIKRALIMLPPLDRDKLPQHLSKFYGKTCPKKALSFISFLGALIRGSETKDIKVFQKCLKEGPTIEILDSIVKYLVNNIGWFTLERKEKQLTKSWLSGMAKKLSDSQTKSKGKKGTTKSLFSVAFETTKKRKRGDTAASK